PRGDEPGTTGAERPLPVAHDVAQRQVPLMSMLEPVRDGSGDRLVDRTAGPSRPVVPVLSRRASASLGQRASVQQAGNVEAHALRGGNALAGPQVLPASHELRDGAGADPRQLVPHGLGKVHEEAHDVVRVTGEAPAQLRVLRRDAHRTGVEVTLAQHGAAQRDEGRGAEPELFCAERGRDDDVASGLQTAVHAQGHAATEVVLYQRTLNVDEPQLPRLAGVLDAAQGTGSGAAVVARDLDVVGVALGHARSDRPNAPRRDELHANPRSGADALEVVDELSEVFYRVDVVVRWRADERDAGDRMANRRDLGRHLEPWYLAALPRLGALRHLDLDLFGAGQVLRSDAEAAGRYLFYRAVRVVAGCRVP